MRVIVKVGIAAISGLLVLAGTQAATAVDLTESHYAAVNDTGGANDQPGQKDLTRQGSDTSNSAYIDTYIQWDDLTVSGNNTLDGCSLIDTDGDGNANAAICATLSRDGASAVKLKSWSVYTCNDSRSDRCSGSTLVGVPGTTSTIGEGTLGCSDPIQVSGAFDTTDTRVYCTITALSIGSSGTFTLRNTCSYPSSVPNSDPSDCVLKTRVNPGSSTGSTTAVAVLANASLSLTGNGTDAVTGTATFVLAPVVSGVCGTAVYTAAAVPVALVSGSTYAAATSNTTFFVGSAGSPTAPAGTYGWTITYTGDGNYNPVTATCVQQFTAS